MSSRGDGDSALRRLARGGLVGILCGALLFTGMPAASSWAETTTPTPAASDDAATAATVEDPNPAGQAQAADAVTPDDALAEDSASADDSRTEESEQLGSDMSVDDTSTLEDADAVEAQRADTLDIAAALSLVSLDDGVPTGTGTAPTVASAVAPSTAIASGQPRTFTVTYTNEQAAPLTNARLWHEYVVGGRHASQIDVSCTSQVNGQAGGDCPPWVPTATEIIAAGQADESIPTFAGVFTFQPKQQLTFTVTVTSTFAPDACTETGSAQVSGLARYSATGFADVDIARAASSTAPLTGAAVCAAGAIRMTNTVQSPRPPSSAPSRVLSGDARVYAVSWENTAANAYSTPVPLTYDYFVPYAGQATSASWSCTSTINGVAGGACPAFLTGSNSAVPHDAFGEAVATVFAGEATFAARQKFTVTVTLTTTLSGCAPSGAIIAQTFATRGPIDGELDRRTASSEQAEIGCTTWLLEEDFNDTAMADSAWRGLNQACLTRATGSVTQNGVLGRCSNRTNSPTTTFQSPVGTTKGFLQFTDDRTDQVGAVLYNRGLPAKDGIVVEFTQYQYGNDAGGADGIGFFLSDGSYSLTEAGGGGGALGYAYRETPTGEQGLSHGYLGLGLDVFGNYVSASHVAPACAQTSTAKSQSVALRGAGNARTGYCLIGQTRISDAPLSKRLDYPSAAIPAAGNANYDNQVRAAITAAQRDVRITIHPTTETTALPRVTVEIRFPGEDYYRTVLDATMDQPAPTLVKFGLMGATGGSKQVHLIGDVRIGTVLPMKELNLVKAVDYASNADPEKQTFDVGDTVHYQFVVHNVTQATDGSTDIYNLQVTDPLISNIDCGGVTTLPRLGSITCTGSLVVTEAQRDTGYVRNTATAAGSVSSASGAPRNLTARSTVDVPVNPTATPDLRVIVPGGIATFQVLKYGTTLGLVQPDDPSKITIKLIDPATGQPTNATSITVSGQGTWTINANNTVTFTPVTASFSGTVTPMTYQASNVYGGTARSTLSVVISVTPYAVCTADEQRASERYWAFGSQALLDFGSSGTSVTTGTLSNVSGGVGTFTVTDPTGALQFVVDPGNGGRIVDRNGAAILTGLGTPTTGTVPTGGASQATVFPAGQGTGKYFVVVSTASSTAAGQLRYWIVDMALNGGTGAIASGPTTLGTSTNASMAIASVPNADGTGYWVISPDKRAVTSGGTYNYVRAYSFSATAPTNASSPVLSSLGTAAVPATGTIPRSYEDIRFQSDLSRFATIASNGTTSKLRILQLNAATGVVSGAVTTYLRDWTTSNALGYSVEFSPSGDILYTSSIASTGSNAAAERRAISATALSDSPTRMGALQSNGGAVRLAPEGGRLYWAANGAGSLRYLGAPSSAGNSTTWSTLNLATSRTSGYGLSNTLADCAIPPSGLALEKYDSDGVLVGGAQFALYPDNGGSAGPTAVSPGIQPGTGTGKFTVAGLAPGKYWLRETKAPLGHSLLAQDVLIEVQLRGVVKLDGAPNPQVKLVRVGDAYVLRVTDVPVLGLPLTGGAGTTAFTVGGGVLLAFVIFGALWWRRRNRNRAASPPGSQGGAP